MKLQGDLNSAENMEQSECAVRDNQTLVDEMDRLDLLLFQISNSLRASRIMIQRNDARIDLDWVNMKDLSERVDGLLASVRLISNDVKRQIISDFKLDPTEYVRNS